MIDESLLAGLKGIGMSEYEAKVYSILAALRVASGREIHELTKIPRGRVYETLAALSKKGFVVSSGTSPARYSPVDLSQAFERLKHDSIQSLDSLYARLRLLETETPEFHSQSYELRTEWTRDNQIRMILRRAKSEIIFLCNDKDFLVRYGSDIAHAAKRIPVYLVVGELPLARFSPVKCYAGGTDIDASLFRHEDIENVSGTMKLFLIADRRETLLIEEENGKLMGIIISPDIFVGYISRKIIQEIRPVKMSA
jgi:HTH-type transcriptional regulator, sugar sensing transcriptional regulator